LNGSAGDIAASTGAHVLQAFHKTAQGRVSHWGGRHPHAS
jgi:hypothetical protein